MRHRVSGKWLNHHKNGIGKQIAPMSHEIMNWSVHRFFLWGCGLELTSWCCFVHGSEGCPRSTPFWLWAKCILPKPHFHPLLNGFTNTYQVKISWSQQGHARREGALSMAMCFKNVKMADYICARKFPVIFWVASSHPSMGGFSQKKPSISFINTAKSFTWEQRDLIKL